MSAYWTMTMPRRRTAGRPGVVALLRTWYMRSRQRRALAQLDHYLLRDCGLTREQVEQEIDKPFWVA